MPVSDQLFRNWQDIAIRAVVMGAMAVVLARADRTRYRAWRKRSALWQHGDSPPPPEYVLESQIWRLRLFALVVCTSTMVGLTAYLIISREFDWWLIGLLAPPAL